MGVWLSQKEKEVTTSEVENFKTQFNSCQAADWEAKMESDQQPIVLSYSDNA